MININKILPNLFYVLVNQEKAGNEPGFSGNLDGKRVLNF